MHKRVDFPGYPSPFPPDSLSQAAFPDFSKIKGKKRSTEEGKYKGWKGSLHNPEIFKPGKGRPEVVGKTWGKVVKEAKTEHRENHQHKDQCFDNPAKNRDTVHILFHEDPKDQKGQAEKGTLYRKNQNGFPLPRIQTGSATQNGFKEIHNKEY